MTDAELAALKRRNPELTVVDYDRAPVPVQTPQALIASEHDLQVAVIAACDALAATDDRYSMIHAIPNGGARSKGEGGKLKAEGVRKGIPDLFLPVPSGMYHGMYIELKWKGNKPKRDQLEWIRRLRALGYHCVVIWDNVQDVMNAIADYLEGN